MLFLSRPFVVVFRGEHIAVRNAEGTFYLCQTLQAIYKDSKKIRIQWLSESSDDKQLYLPEHYDKTGTTLDQLCIRVCYYCSFKLQSLRRS